MIKNEHMLKYEIDLRNFIVVIDEFAASFFRRVLNDARFQSFGTGQHADDSDEETFLGMS